MQVALDQRVRVLNSGRYLARSIPVAESAGVVEQAISLDSYKAPGPLPKADKFTH